MVDRECGRGADGVELSDMYIDSALIAGFTGVDSSCIFILSSLGESVFTIRR